MIIVEIGRGLGNSMYVYAAAKALAEHHQTELKLDTSYLRSWPRWEKYGGAWYFELGKFNISAKEASKKELIRHVIKTGFRPLDRLIRKYRLFERNVVYFPSNGSFKDFFNLSDNTYLWGYMGKEGFFKSVKKIIQKEFTLKKENKEIIMPLIRKIRKGNSVSLHVRRGDVLKLKNAYILPLDFYKKAVNVIKKRVKKPVFYVFSDDIEWCKRNLSGFDIKTVFVEGNQGYEDLELMRSCKHNILAVSALSWWAGYLNTNNKKIVIAPKHFSHFKDVKVDKDVLPKDWIKI